MDEVRRLERRVKQLEQRLAQSEADGKETRRELSLYRRAVETSRDGIVLYDADARMVFCNQRYKELFHKCAQILVPGTTLEEVGRVVAASGQVVTGWTSDRTKLHREGLGDPFFMQFTDGTWVRACNYRTKDGGMLGIRTDVTDLKRKEQELRATTDELQKQLEAFFDHTPVAMYIKDTDRRFRSVNKAFESQFGVTVDQAIGKRATEVMPWSGDAKSHATDTNVLTSGEAETFEHATSRADGTPGTAITTKFPIRNANGDIVAVGGISLDITSYKQVQSQLADKSRLLETTLWSIDQGIAVINTDMRIVACNQKYLNMHAYPRELPEDGLPVIDLMINYAKTGVYGPGDPKELAAERIRRLTGPKPPEREERQQPNGQVLDIRRNILPQGGYVTTCTDITVIKQAERTAEAARLLLHETLDALPASVALYDAQRRLRFCNEATRELFHWQPELHTPGVRYEDQLRDSIAKGMVPDATDQEDAWLHDRLRQYRVSGQNIETQRPGDRWVLSSFRETSDGGTVVIRFDISGRKNAEKALRESEEDFRNLVENSVLGIGITRYTKLLFVNQAAAEIFGFEGPEQLMAVGQLNALALEHEQERMARYGRDRLAGKPVPSIYEFEAARRDGSRIWLQRSSRVVKWHGTRAIQSTFTDITKRRRAEENLRKALEDAEDANRTKSDFLAKMSHELRTPLNAIIGFSEVLGRETFGPLGHENYLQYAEHIAVSGRHLLDMITDILDMSKIESGKHELQISSIDLTTLIHETTRVVSGQIEQQKIALRIDIGDDIPNLHADARAVRQILLNLLSNAIKFTDAGGAITVSASVETNRRIRVAVADTGMGIAAADLDQVLQPFGQVGNAQTNAQPGTGLGLPIVKSLIELHGGWLELKSKPGVGTTVIVDFPDLDTEAQNAAAN